MTTETRKPIADQEAESSSPAEVPWFGLGSTVITNHPGTDMEQGLSASERSLLREVICALRAIRYGSVVLTVHDGRLVELSKTERIRNSSPNRQT